MHGVQLGEADAVDHLSMFQHRVRDAKVSWLVGWLLVGRLRERLVRSCARGISLISCRSCLGRGLRYRTNTLPANNKLNHRPTNQPSNQLSNQPIQHRRRRWLS